MNKTWLLFKQNYIQKFRGKAFLIMTLLYMAVIIVGVNWQNLSALITSDEEVTVAVIDETEQARQSFESVPDLRYVAVTDSAAAVNKAIKKGVYDAGLYLSDENGQLKAQFVTYNDPKLATQQAVEASLSEASNLYLMNQLRLKPEQVKQLTNATVSLDEVSLKESNGKSATDKVVGIAVSYVVGFLIYLFVMTYSSMITTDIASEKGSRVLEVLMSAARPSQHLVAKISSTLAVGLTQVSLIILTAIIALKLANTSLWHRATELMNEISLTYFVITAGFFLFTLSLYLVIGAFTGSLVSKVEEASQAALPGMMLIMTGLFSMIYGMSNPDAFIIKVLSFVPFTAGFIMPLRFSATDIGLIPALIALVSLIVTVVVLFIFTNAMYRRSVLSYSSGSLIQKVKNILRFTT